MSDPTTIEIYDRNVEKYAGLGTPAGRSRTLDAFLAHVREGGLVLDWGCGPGHDAACMAERGFDVDAVDASAAMVRHVVATHGIRARQGLFADLDAVEAYDGVWANFSLLHAEHAELPRHLRAAFMALRDRGVFYLTVKSGKGAGRDELGRLYAYYSQQELKTLLQSAGFELLDTFSGTSAGLSGREADWIGLSARKTR